MEETVRHGLRSQQLLPPRLPFPHHSPQAELDFKFYRQATDKIAGISDAAAAFLRRLF
jgi:hypothetical protein